MHVVYLLQLTGDPDQATLVMTQMNGLVMIGGALVWLLTRETRDGTVAITLMMARVFVSEINHCYYGVLCHIPY